MTILKAHEAVNLACELALSSPRRAVKLAYEAMVSADQCGDWYTAECAHELLSALGQVVFPVIPEATASVRL